MMDRKSLQIQYIIQDEMPADFGKSIIAWLEKQAKTYGLRWLLAHADDGVIWGEVRHDVLHLSSAVFKISPTLHTRTLQQARLFGEKGELHLWRTDTGWHARLIQEGTGETKECYDEEYLLWGDVKEDSQDGFVLLRQGAEGLRHAPPIETEDMDKLPMCLTVRHFLAYDDDDANNKSGVGQAYVAFSRLVKVGPAKSAGR